MSESVRSFLRLPAKIPAPVLGPIMMFGPLVGAIYIVATAHGWVRVFMPVFLLFFGAFLMYHMLPTQTWVEFDGETVRAKNLYTRREVAYPLCEVKGVRVLYALSRQQAVNKVIDITFGPIRGYEIQIEGRRRGIAMARLDHSNPQQLAETIANAKGIKIENLPESKDSG